MTTSDLLDGAKENELTNNHVCNLFNLEVVRRNPLGLVLGAIATLDSAACHVGLDFSCWRSKRF